MNRNVMSGAVVAVLFLASATMAQAPEFQPVGTMRQIMLEIVAPTSDVILKVSGKVPKNDKEWKIVQDSALTLSEAGNLLLIPGRAKDNGDWAKYSKALIDAGSEAFKAANAKNAKAFHDVGNKIDVVCETCHAKYLPRAAR